MESFPQNSSELGSEGDKQLLGVWRQGEEPEGGGGQPTEPYVTKMDFLRGTAPYPETAICACVG